MGQNILLMVSLRWQHGRCSLVTMLLLSDHMTSPFLYEMTHLALVVVPIVTELL